MMTILPIPAHYEEKKGFYQLSQQSRIILEANLDASVFQDVLFFNQRLEEEVLLDFPVLKGKSKRYSGIHLLEKEDLGFESYLMEVKDKGIYIYASSPRGHHYGLMTLLQLVKKHGLKIPYLRIKDQPRFAHRGFYHDVTRGKVPSKKTLFRLIDDLSEYKVNELQLYIEHTYLWEGLSEVFRAKDALSAQDILEIDAYAHQRHIELIPSIATFGHMYEILESQSFRHLSEKPIDDSIPYSWVNRMAHHTIDVSQEESIDLVRKLIEDFIPLFRSKKFNICGDETFDLGAYRNKELAEKESVGRLYVDFLNKIIEIVQENDREVLFWGDIILNYPELLAEIPNDVVCLNWGYMANEKEDNTRIVSESKVPQYVCPSTTGWNRMINWLDNSSENIRTMVSYADKYDAYGILNTDWGDHGHVNLLGSSMPMVVYAAALSWNPVGLESDAKADPIISQSYYGEEHKDILDLLRRISRQQPANWSYINFHLERDFANQDVVEPYFDIMRELDTEEIYQSVNNLAQLKLELLEKGSRLPQRFQQDFKEFLVMTDLMSLTQESFLYMMKYDMKVEGVKLTRSSWSIAEDIEYAMEAYAEVWRARNRESELFRIRDKFYEIADRLRKYEDN